MKKPVSIMVLGKVWFRKSAGNSYCSAEIFVDGVLLEKIRASGGGDYYLQIATDKLEQAGYMPGREHYQSGGGEAAWRYFETRGVKFHNQHVHVGNEKDL